MQSLVKALNRAVRSGAYASIASTLVLMQRGVRDCRSAIAPVNAVSHWLWKNKAIYRQDATVRYSLTGYLIHHAASVFWAFFYELWAVRADKPVTVADSAKRGAVVASVACAVDLRCTPKRLTPGFERRLGNKSLFLVYTAFGLGLVAHTLLHKKRRR